MASPHRRRAIRTASATVNSTFHIGGSIGLAVFTVLYATALSSAQEIGADQATSLTEGYIAVFTGSGIAMIIAALLAIVFIRGTKNELMPQTTEEQVAVLAH